MFNGHFGVYPQFQTHPWPISWHGRCCCRSPVPTGDNEKQGRWAMMGAGLGVEHASFKVLPAGFFPLQWLVLSPHAINAWLSSVGCYSPIFSSLLFSDSSHLCFSICPYWCRKFDFKTSFDHVFSDTTYVHLWLDFFNGFDHYMPPNYSKSGAVYLCFVYQRLITSRRLGHPRAPHNVELWNYVETSRYDRTVTFPHLIFMYMHVDRWVDGWMDR